MIADLSASPSQKPPNDITIIFGDIVAGDCIVVLYCIKYHNRRPFGSNISKNFNCIMFIIAYHTRGFGDKELDIHIHHSDVRLDVIVVSEAKRPYKNDQNFLNNLIPDHCKL